MKAVARNKKTGETRPVTMTLAAMERVMEKAVGSCAGPCRCRVEPDGWCPKGWPSKLLAVGMI